MHAVTTFDEFKTLASQEDGFDGFIALSFGKSNKQIWYVPENGSWSVIHSIDDSEAVYDTTDDFVAAEDHIMEAISKGALYQY